MNFFTMKEIVDNAQKKKEEQKNAIEKKFTLPAVGATEAAADEPKKTKKTKKTDPQISEGKEADNIIPEDEPEDDTQEEEE